MGDLKAQVSTEIITLLDSLKTLAQKNPDTPVRGAFEDFNQLLARAQEAFPNVKAVQQASQLTSSDSLGTAVSRLSVLHGAIIGATH